VPEEVIGLDGVFENVVCLHALSVQTTISRRMRHADRRPLPATGMNLLKRANAQLTEAWS
jgi:hypothetical protein